MSRRLQNWLPQSRCTHRTYAAHRRLRFFYFFCGNGHFGVRRSTGWFLIDNILLPLLQNHLGSGRYRSVYGWLRSGLTQSFPISTLSRFYCRFSKRTLLEASAFLYSFSLLLCSFLLHRFYFLSVMLSAFPAPVHFPSFLCIQIGRLPRLKHCSFSAQMSMPENSRQQSERLRLKWWELYAAVQTDLKSIRRWWSESCR